MPDFGCPLKFISNTLTFCQDHANAVLTSINWSKLSLINEPSLALNSLVSKIKICPSKAEYSKKDYKKNI